MLTFFTTYLIRWWSSGSFWSICVCSKTQFPEENCVDPELHTRSTIEPARNRVSFNCSCSLIWFLGLNVFWCWSYHVLRYAVPIFWWSISSRVVHHRGGNKISHALKNKLWTSFRVRDTLLKEVTVWFTVVHFSYFLFLYLHRIHRRHQIWKGEVWFSGLSL